MKNSLLLRPFRPVISTLILISFLVFSSCAHNQKTDKSAKQAKLYLQIANSYLEHYKLPEALSTFIEAQKLTPEDPEVHNGLGMTYLLRKKYQLSEKHFKKALVLNPAFTDTRNNMARLYIEQGKYMLALKQLEIAKADLTYGSPDTIQFLYGLIAFKTKKYEKAQLFLGRVHKKNPKHCETAVNLGRTLYYRGLYENSLVVYDEALKSCEKNYTTSLNYFKALSYIKLNKTLLAKTYLNNILFTNPNSDWALRSKQRLSLLK
jgi:type IV pilus assembly protein PilF